MRPALLLLPLLPWLAAAVPVPQDERAALLASPAWVERRVEPEFVEMHPNDLRDALRVIASRSFAEAGFNTPEIQLHLPLVANSTYAAVEMREPRLVGIDGSEVGFELERGPHDVETQIVEIRLLDRDGRGPAEFARAVGEVQLRYPLRVETRSVAAGQPDPVARIDGPYVEIVEGVLAEAPSFSPLESVRGYDAEGRQLQTAPFSSIRMRQGRAFRRIAFRGDVARAELDRATHVADVVVRYDVPVADALSKLQMGLAPEDERAVLPHPSTRLAVHVSSSEAGTPLPPPLPAPTPTPAPPPAPAPPMPTPEPAPASGPVVPVLEREALSPEARILAGALETLVRAVPEPLALVQLVAYPPSMLTLTVDRGERAEEWTWRDGQLNGPREIDTSGLECPGGMSPGALTLERLPALRDDAVRRVPAPDDAVARIVAGQHPCGTPFIRVPFRSGTRVVYAGDGHFVRVE